MPSSEAGACRAWHNEPNAACSHWQDAAELAALYVVRDGRDTACQIQARGRVHRCLDSDMVCTLTAMQMS